MIKKYNKFLIYFFIISVIYLYFCYQIFPEVETVYFLAFPFIILLFISIKMEGLSKYMKDKEQFVIAIIFSIIATAFIPIFYFLITILLGLIL